MKYKSRGLVLGFLFAQRSGQTRLAERCKRRPDQGEDNPNRKGVTVTWGLKEAIGSERHIAQADLIRLYRRVSVLNSATSDTWSGLWSD